MCAFFVLSAFSFGSWPTKPPCSITPPFPCSAPLVPPRLRGARGGIQLLFGITSFVLCLSGRERDKVLLLPPPLGVFVFSRPSRFRALRACRVLCIFSPYRSSHSFADERFRSLTLSSFALSLSRISAPSIASGRLTVLTNVSRFRETNRARFCRILRRPVPEAALCNS